MKPNYRVIIISILDGSLYDITEWEHMAQADEWALNTIRQRWDLHAVYISLDEGTPHVMGRIAER